jgi:hypothetical protein
MPIKDCYFTGGRELQRLLGAQHGCANEHHRPAVRDTAAAHARVRPEAHARPAAAVAEGRRAT